MQSLLGLGFLVDAISLEIHQAPKVWPGNGAQWKPTGDQMQSGEAQMELKRGRMELKWALARANEAHMDSSGAYVEPK